MKKKQLLVIGLVWPEPNSSAAGIRILQLMDLFLAQDFEIIFASAAQESEFSFDLQSKGIQKKSIELNSSSFDEFVAKLQPDIVLFDRYISEEQFGWRISENCPETIRILDTEDLHCLRLERQNAIKKGNTFVLEDLLLSDIAKREIASIYRCDLTLMISEFEMYILQEIFGLKSELLYYLPLFYEVKKQSEMLTFEERENFVFIGNFIHEPNWDAVKELKTKIWPTIRKRLPDAKLLIYGAYPTQKVLQLHNEKEGFLITGRAQSASEVIEKAKVLLAPLRFGAGQKGKLLEAMQVGTCSITTSIGAEGIVSESEWNGFVMNDWDSFIEASIRLYTDQNLWNERQKKGYIALEKFSQDNFKKEFSFKLMELSNHLKKHRQNNFIGNLLQQQAFQATRFMSKWIEEKNKKASD
ncbi:glycosyltransferase [Flavobacterium luminosum]|uniref:Glycosyltransferase family 4 protein n=1 Tax=Flavobacterium luminosum TaxID=2949086 RepID=A0ABT0TMR8_9FLAO|nr:glycosyltransferase [Flavobacterium sp. HXWNR70]MCL9808778.1 glycosyltransferase family 4 protein [Flavobacterium sp. HXWNR70]